MQLCIIYIFVYQGHGRIICVVSRMKTKSKSIKLLVCSFKKLRWKYLLIYWTSSYATGRRKNQTLLLTSGSIMLLAQVYKHVCCTWTNIQSINKPTEKWAKCYRLFSHSDMDTNMFLERLDSTYMYVCHVCACVIQYFQQLP